MHAAIDPNDRIFQLLLDKEEITWQTILYQLVKSEEMNPWDIDVSRIAKKYIDMVKKLQQHDLRVSGKVVLAAAILLRIKSNRLVGEDLDYLDSLFARTQQDVEEELYEELMAEEHHPRSENYMLIPKTPQPRSRKVSVYDLINALEKALEVKRRRVLASMPPGIDIPRKSPDISKIIRDLYQRIKGFFLKSRARLTFSQLVPSDAKEDKVYTFIPLLHLAHQQKVDLRQYTHFGEIDILLKDK